MCTRAILTCHVSSKCHAKPHSNLPEAGLGLRVLRALLVLRLPRNGLPKYRLDLRLGDLLAPPLVPPVMNKDRSMTTVTGPPPSADNLAMTGFFFFFFAFVALLLAMLLPCFANVFFCCCMLV